MSRGIGKEELNSILASYPRLVGSLRGTIMAGFLSKAELEALVTGSVQTADIANGAIAEAKLAADAVTAAKIKDAEVGAAEIAAGVVSKAKLGYKSVAVNVAATATSGSSAADPDLVGGEILGVYSAGNQDQLVDNVVLNADGSVTVTLAAAATAENNFKVVVAKP
jgi:hypothetical protein